MINKIITYIIIITSINFFADITVHIFVDNAKSHEPVINFEARLD